MTWTVTGSDGDALQVDVYPSNGNAPVVIAAHGMSGSRKAPYITGAAKAWSRTGLTVVAADAPHHGDRADEPMPRALEMLASPLDLLERSVGDLRAVVDAVVDRIDPPSIGLLGFSMGSVSATFLAASDPRVESLVLCIGGSTWEAVRRRMPMAVALKSRITAADPATAAPRVSAPVLMLQADRDEIFSREAACALYDGFNPPRAVRFLEGTHSNWRHPADWYRRMRWWFDSTLSQTGSSGS